MRSIKFRIWDKKSKGKKKFSYPNEVGVINMHGAVPSLRDLIKHNTLKSRFGFQQCTDILDKNNTLIYEGDIVKTDIKHLCFIVNSKTVEYTKGVVKWERGGFYIYQPGVGSNFISDYVVFDCHPGGLEVIGNILETSDVDKKHE